MKKILLLAFCASYLTVNSQVYDAGTHFSVYKDINPDSLLTYLLNPSSSESLNLNLFNSSSANLQINAFGSTSPGGTLASISVFSLTPEVLIRFGRWDSLLIPAYSFWDVSAVALPLKAGDQINSSSAIWDTLLYLTDHSGYGDANKNVNDWIGMDKYIGLKYQKGSDTEYGWIRVQCPAKDSCYVKDYSYSSSALTVQKIEEAKFKIFPNPVNHFLYLENLKSGAFDITHLKILNILGKEIKFSCEMENYKLKINLDPAVPEGCYIVRYCFEEQYVTCKFLKIQE